MRLAPICAVALAEMRSARRQVRTWVFILLAVGVPFLMFVEAGVSHARGGWISPSAALPAPRFVMSQVGVFLVWIFLVGVIFLAFDVRARDRRERMVEVLDARPVSNVQLLTGRVLGVVATALVPTLLLLVLVQAFGTVGGALGAPTEPVQGVSLATFLLVDAVPMFVAWSALVVLLAVLLRNRLLVAIAALGLFLAWIRWSMQTPPYLAHLVGPTAFTDLVSDLLPRFAEPETLVHRLLLLVLAAGVLAFAAVLHPRPDGKSRFVGIAIGAVFLAVGGAGMFGLHRHASDGLVERQRWLAAHRDAAQFPRADIEHLGGIVRIDPGRSLDVDLVMRVAAPAIAGADRTLVFSFNPGMSVGDLRVDGEPVAVTHRDGLLTIPRPPTGTFELALRASGVPDPDFAYLDSDHDFSTDGTANQGVGVFLGRDASIFEPEYVALMPGIRWLPTPGANVGIDDPARFGRDFFTADLVVEVPSGWLVAGPGRRQGEGEGRFRLASRAPVPAIAVLAAAFERRSMEVAGVELELLMDPRHAGTLASFEDAEAPLREYLGERFDDAARLGLVYPYEALSLVEAPAALRIVGGGWRMPSVQGLPGVMLMGERGFPTARFDLVFRRAGKFEELEGGVEAFKIRSLRRFFSNDFKGGDPSVGVARNFLHHQAGVEPGGMGATALEYVVEELVTRLLTGSDAFFSAHIFTPKGDGSLGLLMQTATEAFDFGSGPSRALDVVANRPVVWDLVLGTSLADLDPSLDAARVMDVLALKGRAVARSILDALGRETAGAFLAELRRRHLGGHYDLAAFYAAAREVGADLEALLGDWQNDAALPGFLASTATFVRLPETGQGTPLFQTRVHIRNDEPAPGLVRLRYVTRGGRVRGQGAEFTEPVRVTGNSSVEVALVTTEPVAMLWMSPYLSLNRRDVRISIDRRGAGQPEAFRERMQERAGRPGGGGRRPASGGGMPGRPFAERDPRRVEPATGTDLAGVFHGARPSDWVRPADVGIVVDDLDAGFGVERDGKPSGLRIGPRLRPADPVGEMDHGIPSFTSAGAANGGTPVLDGEWRRQEMPSSFGRYRHTVARASADGGHARAVFEAELPRAGEWRLEYHMPFVPPKRAKTRFRGRGMEMRSIGELGEYDMALQYGDGQRIAVPFDGTDADTGWNDLGRYELPAGSVRLVVSNRTTGEIVLADAIRWRGEGQLANRHGSRELP